jgi:heptosyltransferase-3
MRRFDRFLGVPLCLLTGILRSGSHRRNPVLPVAQWRSVLVVKFFGIGSVLLSSGFLSALREQTSARIMYLTFESNREIIDRLPQADVRLTISTSSIPRFARDVVTAILRIRREHVQVVFDLEFFSKFSTLVSVLSGASLRSGYSLPTRWRRMNLTHAVPLRHDRHVTESFLAQLTQFGLDPGSASGGLRIQSDPREQDAMRKKLGLGPNGRAVVCVNINAGSTSLERRWPPERFVDVADILAQQHPGTHFFFTGSLIDRPYVERALETKPSLVARASNIAGMLSIGELIALFENSKVLITNDSGPMHIASSVGLPVVALFGPESPVFYGPLGPGTTIGKRLPCSPCLNVYDAKLFVCPIDARCMKEITVAEVVIAANAHFLPREVRV